MENYTRNEWRWENYTPNEWRRWEKYTRNGSPISDLDSKVLTVASTAEATQRRQREKSHHTLLDN
jgi:hypothetical protein